MEAAGALLVALLEQTLEHFLDAVPKVSAEERVEQRIHSRVEVGDQERKRSEQGVEIRVPLVVLGPV